MKADPTGSVRAVTPPVLPTSLAVPASGTDLVA